MSDTQILTVTNFKKFQKISLPLAKDLLICGNHDTGKSQILWAYLLFFRAYNAQSPSGLYSPVYLKAEVQILLDQRIFGLLDWTSFVNKSQQGKGEALFTASLSKKHKFEVSLKANGNLVFTGGKSTLSYNGSKIHFAHMTSSYLFTERTTLPTTFITSNDDSLRYRYYALGDNSQKYILTLIESLFPIERIAKKVSKFSILFTAINEECGSDIEEDQNQDEDTSISFEIGLKRPEIELMFLSPGCQKVFAAFILLYTLIEIPLQNDDDRKYYLIDDIECKLELNVAEKFYDILQHICETHNITLIGTSCGIVSNQAVNLNKKR